MLALVSGAVSLAGGLRGVLAASASAIAVFALLTTYDRMFDDPLVSRAAAATARSEYVDMAEKAATAAANAETRRQREARETAQADFTQKKLIEDAIDATRRQELEQEILNYEAKLRAVGRVCDLDAADIDFLLKSQRPPVRSLSPIGNALRRN